MCSALKRDPRGILNVSQLRIAILRDFDIDLDKAMVILGITNWLDLTISPHDAYVLIAGAREKAIV